MKESQSSWQRRFDERKKSIRFINTSINSKRISLELVRVRMHVCELCIQILSYYGERVRWPLDYMALRETVNKLTMCRSIS